jgi:hypothetical protein
VTHGYSLSVVVVEFDYSASSVQGVLCCKEQSGRATCLVCSMVLVNILQNLDAALLKESNHVPDTLKWVVPWSLASNDHK